MMMEDTQALMNMAQELRAMNQRITQMLDVLRPRIGGKLSASPMYVIAEIVAANTNLTVKQLLSRDKRRHICVSRFVAIYLTRELTLISSVKVAEFYNRDHTSILHAERSVGYWLADGDRRGHIAEKLRPIAKAMLEASCEVVQ